MSTARHHAEWLTLVEVSGPFLSIPVLMQTFPSGLDRRADESDLRERLLSAHAEWQDDQGGLAPDAAIHRAWIRYVLREALELPTELLAEGQELPGHLAVPVPEHHTMLRPSLALRSPDPREPVRLLIDIVGPRQRLESPLPDRTFSASPAARMMTLLHGTAVPLGLVTNGEHFMLVHAAAGATTSYASFFASLWREEPLTLRAFTSLLSAHRFFGVEPGETLPALFARSAADQQEVTNQLGSQVRRAVEVLIQSIDRLDRDRGRKLLEGFDETNLYEAAVTVMMRVVFLVCAEERELLPRGSRLYDQHYAVATLREQLQDVADRHGEQVLRHRYAAWSRLLATFRAVHGGALHEEMRLPAYGGSLFDPDRFPFLEGRGRETSWRDELANPLAIDDLTVLDILTSIQMLEVKVPGGGPAEARRLSFRALDVEQIGHVYEGLLDHTARRAASPVVSLRGGKGKEPEVALDELRRHKGQGDGALLEYLQDATGRSPAALRKALAYEVAPDEAQRWIVACDNKPSLWDEIRPWAGLVRADAHGTPLVFDAGAVYVTDGEERRATGTHYTPRTLTEPIVRYTLEPLVYEGPAEGWDPERWRLRAPRDILALKVCDMAMGSGAFLVQACRYLSERLVEAWGTAAADAGGELVITPDGDVSRGGPTERPLPKDPDERLAIARRLVADRCLYGVDRNPMAVEMAKLSLWLVTLQRDKPFTFLDHALRSGDSLLGVTDLEQIRWMDLDVARGKERHADLLDFARVCGEPFGAAVALRGKLESIAVETVRDAEDKRRLLVEAQGAIVDARRLADAVVEERLAGRRPFHWVLEFPEVVGAHGGFDAFVGNPPYMHGSFISTTSGTNYAAHLKQQFPSARGKVDLCVFFLLRAAQLLQRDGRLGLLLTAKANEGASRRAGTDELLTQGFCFAEEPRVACWPGDAQILIAAFFMSRRARLTTPPARSVPHELAGNDDFVFLGAKPDSLGFVLEAPRALSLLASGAASASVLRPYLSGDDINEMGRFDSYSRYIVDFTGLTLEEASRYPVLLKIVEELVKPHRLTLKRSTRLPGSAAG